MPSETSSGLCMGTAYCIAYVNGGHLADEE